MKSLILLDVWRLYYVCNMCDYFFVFVTDFKKNTFKVWDSLVFTINARTIFKKF